MKSKSKKTKSVYRSQNNTLRDIFARAGDPQKILCVAIDYAKRKHLALICDGHGDILKNHFPVDNTPEGVAFLIEQITLTARRRKIPQTQIFLGGEDEPTYVANFTAALRNSGYLVMRVNAHEAKENRESHAASTDALDLIGIAKTLLSRRALPSGDNAPSDPAYYQLRELTRARRALIRQQTATANRIHAIVDQLLPGFLDASKSGLTPFSEASIALMKQRFSATEIARRKPTALAKTLRHHRVHHPEQTAAKIIQLARNALPPAPHRIAALQRTLTAAVDLHHCLTQNAHDLRQQAAQTLLTTPYALLTSIPGIGFVLAAGIAGELGHPDHLRSTDSLCSYAGIVPKTLQTGGPDSPAKQSHTSPRCNRILKDWTVQSAQKIHYYGVPEHKDRITRWNAQGRHGLYAGARHYLRLLRTIVKNRIPYLNPAARAQAASKEQLSAGALETWTILQNKWRTIPGGIDGILDEAHHIGYWRRVLKQTRDIDLPPDHKTQPTTNTPKNKPGKTTPQPRS
jgi:transposase